MRGPREVTVETVPLNGPALCNSGLLERNLADGEGFLVQVLAVAGGQRVALGEPAGPAAVGFPLRAQEQDPAIAAGADARGRRCPTALLARPARPGASVTMIWLAEHLSEPGRRGGRDSP